MERGGLGSQYQVPYKSFLGKLSALGIWGNLFGVLWCLCCQISQPHPRFLLHLSKKKISHNTGDQTHAFRMLSTSFATELCHQPLLTVFRGDRGDRRSGFSLGALSRHLPHSVLASNTPHCSDTPTGLLLAGLSKLWRQRMAPGFLLPSGARQE